MERFFAEFFGFFFDNTSACYLVFAFFFSTLLSFILLLCYLSLITHQRVTFHFSSLLSTPTSPFPYH